MKKIKITIQDYDYECGDGCFDEAGKEWYVDGKFVHRSPCENNGLIAVLAHLGFDATLTGVDKDGEEVWEL